MTWKEMKEFCASLDEGQLKKKVILWRECEAINNITSIKLEEDYYINPEEGESECYPESDAGTSIEDLKKVYDKYDPILCEVF